MSKEIQPIFILPEDTTRTSGKQAQKINIAAAKQVADQVRTTLGPKGMDKMIVDSLGDVTVTNDGVTILEEMHIEHPSAKMVVEVAKTQEIEVGDGTTTAVILAGEFLKNAETLLDDGIHPTVIIKGYKIAAERSIEILNQLSEPVNENSEDILKKIAITAMTGKGAESSKELLADLVVKATNQIIEKDGEKIKLNSDNVKIEKKIGDSVDQSSLIHGVVVDKGKVHSGMPSYVKNAKIALLDSAIEIKDTEVEAKIQITDPRQMQAFIDQEEEMLKKMVDKIVEVGATVVFCQKGIDDIAQHFLYKNGIFAVRRTKQSDMQSLARATGASIVTNIHDLSKEDIGFAGFVEEHVVGEEEMIYVEKCKNPKSVTILVRGTTEHVTEEIKRAVDDAVGDIIAALKMKKVVMGAGAVEIELQKQLLKFSNSLSGKEQLAVKAFANSFEIIPRTLAENAGLDQIDVITELKSAHDKKENWAGIDIFSGKVVNSWKKGIIEPLKIKTQAITSSAEVAEMILRIDDVISGGRSDKPQPGAGYPGMQDM